MNLSKLLEKLSYTLVSGSVETQVESLTSDSRKVRENTAFVCIVGAVSDGHTYIQAAVEQKASVIVVQQGCKEEYLAQIPDTVTVVSVENTRYALAFMSVAYFDDPAEKLFMQTRASRRLWTHVLSAVAFASVSTPQLPRSLIRQCVRLPVCV